MQVIQAWIINVINLQRSALQCCDGGAPLQARKRSRAQPLDSLIEFVRTKMLAPHEFDSTTDVIFGQWKKEKILYPH